MLPLDDPAGVNDSLKMEDIAFSDWPGQPVDLNSGNNPWLPAYGFQTPSALLEKEDFIGNPDAEYFLQGTTGHYMYLETILEETSDDLRSESDLDSRGSPVGWLATDSESGSVICIDATDDLECDSDRELACPAKRRKQDLYLNLPTNDEDLNSLSRSSSLLQFETLEKQCQETSSSPSIFSQFSFDSLEITTRKTNVSPDSLNSPKSEEESDFYKSLKIDVPRVKDRSDDSLLYNATRYSGSDSSDSDATLEASRSFDNLKTWRSFDSLPIGGNKGVKEKASVENLSEDSGYSDHLTKSSSANNLKEKERSDGRVKGMKGCPEKKNSYVGFAAYDGDVFQNFNGNFGVSYQDLTVFRDDHLDVVKTSPLIDHFVKNKKRRQSCGGDVYSSSAATPKTPTKIDVGVQECDRRRSKLRNASNSSNSEPNLLRTASRRTDPAGGVVLLVSSVPKDLNFIGGERDRESVAVKDWNLADLQSESFFQGDELTSKEAVEQEEDVEMSNYKREGSYTEAMSNRVDLSDDEHSLYNKKKPKLPKTPIVEFDKKVLKAISEQSLQSLTNSSQNLEKFSEAFSSTPISATERRNVASTPNLAASLDYQGEERRKSSLDIRRKGSIIKSSTSTSGLSDVEERTMEASVKSFTGSNGSKGVHFSPVVSEVNWRDDSVSTVTPDRESSYSFGSSSPEQRASPPKQIFRPKARLATPARLSSSQPELSDNESNKREFVDSLRSLRQDYSKSQPDVSRIKRRGSQLVKKDKDGTIVKAYVDSDGIQYKHTHLDLSLGLGLGSEPHQQHDPAAGAGGRQSTTQQQQHQGRPSGAFRPVGGMEAQDARHEVGHAPSGKAKAGGKLGGFFSRLASFRFSLKKGAEEKAKLKKKQQAAAGMTGIKIEQRVATKDDYIYIPLKGPPAAPNNASAVTPATTTAATTTTTATGRPPASASKPPLPRQPPRVLHASVKKEAPTPSVAAQQRRRRTIDHAPPMEPMGLIETDLDTEVTVITGGGAKTRSLLDLGPGPGLSLAPDGAAAAQGRPSRPHKSMEFLLDKQNLKVVEPPENELQKGERVMSEHQLRVQRSLQKLTIPEWYKQSQVPREGFLLNKKHSPREARWTGTGGSKTTSLSSLGSNAHSPLVLSPTPCNQPFVRWSTSKLNSTASSPCASTRSSFNTRQPNGSISPSSARSSFSYRQPYMGWRSQERLTRPRTPAERLASSLLSSQTQAQPQESPEIQTSIKEVTSAIVHYVSGLRPEDSRDRSYESQETASQRSSSVSPRGSQKLCWLESSFVGTRPLDSPQTPVTLSESQGHNPVPPSTLRLDLQAHNGKSVVA